MVSSVLSWCLCLILVWLGVAYAQNNLLTNGHAENTHNWSCSGCTLTLDNDEHSGSHSLRISHRTHESDGARHSINVHGGSIYKIVMYVKLLNTAHNAKYQTVEMTMNCKTSNGGNRYMRIGRTPRMTPGHWHAVGGAQLIPAGYHGCSIYLQTPAPADYLIDDAVATQITHDNAWKTKANERINQLRKGNITISIVGSGSADVELIQTKKAFPFGSAVDARTIVNNSNQAYQDIFYKTFDWGVLRNKLKWRLMEWTKGHIDYDTPLTAIDAMKNHGKKVRCHCTFWDKEKNNAAWVAQLSSTDLKAAIHERIQGVIGRTKGKCEQWDINNENLHGSFFEDNTGDLDITESMFRQVHALDAHPKLFLNDFSVISNSDSAVALADLGKKYKADGVPIGGLGVQGHLHHVDIELIKARLELVAEAGLPIMITEFAVNEADVNARATRLVDTLTMLYSLPYIEGIILWGYWDHHMADSEGGLYTGDHVTANAAGRALENLLHNTWMTHETKRVQGNQSVKLAAFTGNYRVNVKQNGHVIKTETLYLGPGGKHIQVHLEGDSPQLVIG